MIYDYDMYIYISSRVSCVCRVSCVVCVSCVPLALLPPRVNPDLTKKSDIFFCKGWLG